MSLTKLSGWLLASSKCSTLPSQIYPFPLRFAHFQEVTYALGRVATSNIEPCLLPVCGPPSRLGQCPSSPPSVLHWPPAPLRHEGRASLYCSRPGLHRRQGQNSDLKSLWLERQVWTLLFAKFNSSSTCVDAYTDIDQRAEGQIQTRELKVR